MPCPIRPTTAILDGMTIITLLPIISALISALVAVCVSLAVVFLGRRTETLKLQQNLRTAAYVDFIRAVAELAILQRAPLQDEEHLRQLDGAIVRVTDAKARIAIYGGKEAITALAKFLRGGRALDSPERRKAFTAICQRFRSDGRPKLDAVSNEDMHFLLFDSEM